MKLPDVITVDNDNEATAQDFRYTCELPKTSSLEDFRHEAAQTARQVKESNVVWLLGLDRYQSAQQQAFIEGFLLATYIPPRAGITFDENEGIQEIKCINVEQKIICESKVRVEATFLARDLTNMPSNIKNPEWMAEKVQELSDFENVSVKVFDEKELKEQGFGGICAVGQGSATPPRFVHISYHPKDVAAGTPHVTLVGKGITFDTGGVNLKPGDAMSTMKTDMEGSAIVFATVRALARLALPVKIDVLMAIAENAIGGAAYRPSDVITIYGGKTVEIGNTDAEGRIVMADALAYADAVIKPDYVIDIATLTGAASMSLGLDHAAYYSNDESLAELMIAAGEATGEYLWRMPLPEEYHQHIKGTQSDLLQIAYDVGAGSIMAALFLQEFAGKTPWAHLDIAGPGRRAQEYYEFSAGATGFGVRMFIDFFQQLAAE